MVVLPTISDIMSFLKTNPDFLFYFFELEHVLKEERYYVKLKKLGGQKMTLVKNKPTYFGTGFPTFSTLFGDLLDRDFSTVMGGDMSKTIPAVNVKETETTYLLELAAPGLKKENFKLSVEENTLTISSEAKQESQDSTEKFTRKEFTYSSFERKFELPESVNIEDITAAYEDGVLKLVLPKRLEELKNTKKKIDVL